MTDRIEQLRKALGERIVLLDGSWGVLIQREVKGEEAYRGERFADHPRDVAGQPRPAQPDAARGRARHPPPLLRGRRGHRDDEHLHGDHDRAGGLRARGVRRRDEPRGRAARPAGGRRGRRLGRRARSVRSTSRSRSRRRSTTLASGSVTFAQVRDAYAEQMAALVEGGVDLLPDRDDLRHAEREGGDRGRTRRRARRAALDLLHRDRPERPQPLRPDSRGLLGVGRARRPASSSA